MTEKKTRAQVSNDECLFNFFLLISKCWYLALSKLSMSEADYDIKNYADRARRQMLRRTTRTLQDCIILHIILSMIFYRLEWVHFQNSILTPTWNFIKHFAISSTDDIDEFPYSLFFQNLVEGKIIIIMIMIIMIIIIIPLFTLDLGRLLVGPSKQETINSNKHNLVTESQLVRGKPVGYLQGWWKIWTPGPREQIRPAVRAWLKLGPSEL